MKVRGKITHLRPDRGFGFIRVDGASPSDKSLFVHCRAIKNRSFDDVVVDDRVEFEVATDPKGQRAVNVFIL
jgi:cold shock CspA family protein